VFFIFWFFLFSVFQTGGDKPMTIVATHDFFNTDNLGNIYLVNDAELVKYNPQGKRTARYSNLKLGAITAIDAMNPLKILVYYRDYQQVIFLDNQLSLQGKSVALEALDLEQSSIVCASVNNGFWVYDRRNNELSRFDETARKVASTGNLRQVLSGQVMPVSMREHNNYLYLNCPGSGIYVFDIFGAFTKLLPLKGVTRFQPEGDIVFCFREGMMCSYNQRAQEERCDSLRSRGLQSAGVRAHKLYRSYGDSLLVTDL
jgi:hypothetical protein